jgi:signal transduction histidine kinase
MLITTSRRSTGMAGPEESSSTRHLALVGQMASVMAHEIRNSLHPLFLLSDCLEAALSQGRQEAQAEMLQTVGEIKAELARLHEVVEDYLSLARLANLHRQPADLGALVETLGREHREQLGEHGIILALEGIEKLGQVFMHQNTVRRALLNLVQNAVESMPQGGTLTLSGQRMVSWVALEIRDTGCGIPPDQLPLLFTPFHTTKPEGTGLGLYVAHQIIEAHQGEIIVHSMPGMGTTFRVTLPIATQEATA